ncbi:MAG: hypothetical protein ABSG51_04705 [Terracidiphilus sp.]
MFCHRLHVHFPGQLAAYRRRYSTSAFVSAEYKKRVADLVDSIRRELKLGRRYSDQPLAEDPSAGVAQRVELQPWLPFASASTAS